MKVFQDFECGIQYDYADYKTKEGKRDYAVVFKYIGNDTKVTVPTEIEGVPVISMSDTFTHREEMEEIILPEKLEKISYGCFRECKKITKITLPETLTSIGPEAFSGCCSLEEIICPESPEWLENIILGNRDLGQNIFQNCPKLCDENGFVLLKSLLVCYDGRSTEITIPDTVTSIADFTFWENKKLKSVSIPDSVTTIGQGAFMKCHSLSKITLPNHIEVFENETFRTCKSLESIVFPENLKEIHNDVFHSCTKLKNIQWNDNVKFFYDGTFSKCTSLEEIHFPNSLEDIGKAFTGCDKLKEITIPANVTMIHEKAFAKCKNLEKVTILPRLESDTRHFTTQAGCFAYTIPMQERFLTQGESPQSRVVRGFNKADEGKFRIDQIKMWEHLSQEEKDFFFEEWKLKISSKVKKGKNRLRNLVFLESTAKEMSVYFNEGCHLELPELEDYLEFSIEKGNTTETALLLDYKNKTFDKSYIEEQETRKEMVEIGLEMPTLKELREKWTVKVDKEYITITGYKGQNTSEIIPESIDTNLPIRYLSASNSPLQNSSFNPLERLVLPENFIKTLNRCFSMSTLKEITLPKSMTEIPEAMFAGAQFLEIINLHDGIKRIEKNAFGSCLRLKEIVFPVSLESIDTYCFQSCFNLMEIRIPKNVKSIKEEAFARCDKLKRVILESATVEIDPTAFVGCEVLEFVGTEGGENLLPSFQK